MAKQPVHKRPVEFDRNGLCPIDKKQFTSSACKHSVLDVISFLEERKLRAIVRDELMTLLKERDAARRAGK